MQGIFCTRTSVLTPSIASFSSMTTLEITTKLKRDALFLSLTSFLFDPTFLVLFLPSALFKEELSGFNSVCNDGYYCLLSFGTVSVFDVKPSRRKLVRSLEPVASV